MLALKPAASDLCAAASVAAITDDQGTLIDQQRYLPFGAERSNVGSIAQTDFGYTGQRDLPSMGLMDYKARFYDSSIGRFIQPDSIIPNPADPQSWNRYGYVVNNPIMFVDPTGHYEDEGCGMEESCELPPDDSPVIIEDEDEQESGHPSNLVVSCFSDPGACYMHGWSNFGAAWSIYSNPNATALNRIGAGLYMGVWVDGHILLGAGLGLAAYAGYVALAGGASACAASVTCAERGTNTVYQVVRNGRTIYVGISQNFSQRAAFWLRTQKWVAEPVRGLGANLTRFQARAVEQVLIEHYGVDNLKNSINSIASSNPIYAPAIQTGNYLLSLIGFE